MKKSQEKAWFNKEIWVDDDTGAAVTADFYNVEPEKRSRIEEAAKAFLDTTEGILKGQDGD